MAKLVLISFKTHEGMSSFSKDKIEKAIQKLQPEHLRSNPIQCIRSGKSMIYVLNPSPVVRISKTGVCLGNVLSEETDWDTLQMKAPLGTYALFRTTNDEIEILTDGVSSRTIWYYFGEDIFVASTSQRAIITLIGNFQFNQAVIPWMLTSGVLGPDNSYDLRIKKLPADSVYHVDLINWKSRLTSRESQFQKTELQSREYMPKLEKELDLVFSRLNTIEGKWVIPLSGGVDSRSLFLLSRKYHIEPDTVTWGYPDSIHEKDSDASIALLLSKKLDFTNRFFPVELKNVEFSEIMTRFLIAGEGRIDHINGYLDGFELWMNLFEENIHGIIRGDEGFGWGQVYTENDVFNSLGIHVFNNSRNWNKLSELGIAKAIFPESLHRKDEESLATWRDRLYHTYRIPVMLSALNDLKLPYVEIANPFLTNNIIDFVRLLPDQYRTDKRLFRSYVAALSPKIPYAKKSSLPTLDQILDNKNVTEYLLKEVNARLDNDIFNPDFMRGLVYLWNETGNHKVNVIQKPGLHSKLKRFIPERIKSILRAGHFNKEIDVNIFLFRVVLLIHMNDMLKKDGSARLVT